MRIKSSILLGLVCGLVFGGLAAASMLPLTFEDKTAALTGALSIGLQLGLLSARQIHPGRVGRENFCEYRLAEADRG